MQIQMVICPYLEKTTFALYDETSTDLPIFLANSLEQFYLRFGKKTAEQEQFQKSRLFCVETPKATPTLSSKIKYIRMGTALKY